MKTTNVFTMAIMFTALLTSGLEALTIFETFDADPLTSGWTMTDNGSTYHTYYSDYSPSGEEVYAGGGYLMWTSYREPDMERFSVALGQTFDQTQEFWLEFDMTGVWHQQYERFWPTAVGVEHLPSGNGLDLGGFFGDSVPLPAEHPEFSDLRRRRISGWDMFIFHNMGNLSCYNLIGICHPRPQLAQIEGIDQVHFVGEWVEHVPEPVITTHRFDTNAQWFWQRFNESYDLTGAMVRDGLLVCFSQIGVNDGVGGRCCV
jgi:hypothetical protein